MKAVCVYCGSSPGSDPAFVTAARGVGRELAASGRKLVYGGGRIGMMGAVADATLAAGGRCAPPSAAATEQRVAGTRRRAPS
jgi:predicted Rossmann-fold nucleotide-binding protein